MPQRVSKKTLYLTSDRSKVVDEGDEDAAFLLVREGSAVDEAELARLEGLGLKVKLSTTDAKVYDARGDHEAKHGGETDDQARAARKRMLDGEPDPDGPAVEGERGDVKASAPKENKAVKNAPDNKGG
jgi:hypothetical protein